MVRFSQSTWNNIVMLIMVIMIFLFMFLTKKMEQQDFTPQARGPLIPAETTLTELIYPTFTVQRIGRGWRTKEAGKLSQEQTAQLITHWLTASVEPTAYQDIVQPISVEMWLAGVSEPLLVDIGQQHINVNGQSFRLINHQTGQLLPIGP